MNPNVRSGSDDRLQVTPSFVLAAAITILFNTVLACSKDGYAPLNALMKRLTGHHWITHGIADVVLFAGLGLIFLKTGAARKIPLYWLTGVLVAAVAVASLGLTLWYLIY